MVPEVIITADGSNSLYLPELDEHYHSIHGAIQEAEHVFMQAGLFQVKKMANPLNILEVGFGTGLNAFLTYLRTKSWTEKVHYSSLETQPLTPDQAAALNYIEQLKAEKFKDIYTQMHNCEWDMPVALSSKFTLEKMNREVQQEAKAAHYHLIYFDAFGPRVQPELWTVEVFENMYAALQPDGMLVTYCAKGQVKRNMKEAGFYLESLPGPPGKREMTRARKLSYC
jgi:tRNA U34 5-methylaminomethyl-2-thiouridine-forming methyltransferase MnmC